MKFRDRIDAGDALADKLIKYGYGNSDTIVLAIPRGGIILADIVAKKIGAEFDILIPRKLGAPSNEELAIGAVMEDGTSYLNKYIIDALHIPKDYIQREIEHQIEEIKRRTTTYRDQGKSYNINGKRTILVDDGIATGATIIASARWLRKNSPSSTIVVAVPVAPPQSIEVLEQEADSVVVLYSPTDFGAVGQFYEKFEPVSDDQVIKIMRARGLL